MDDALRLTGDLYPGLGDKLRIEVGFDPLGATFRAVARILDAAERRLWQRQPKLLIDIMPVSTAAAIAFAVLADLVKA